MQIPFVDLSQELDLKKKILKKLQKVIQRGEFILSPENELFEKEFAEYLQIPYVIGVASGTDALILSLKALEIGKSDEVIVPAMTFSATASAVIHAGATPIFVDILSDYPTINPSLIEQKITKKTKAIIPVHLHGMPCRMTEINEIAKRYNLFVLEDACQAHGSLYKKRLAGTLGDISAFSFYPSKNLGAFGDGGAIATKNKLLAQTIRKLRNHGEGIKYYSNIIGYNSRLDSLHAVVLRYKLPYLTSRNSARRRHADTYIKYLSKLPIQLPSEEKNMKSNYHVFAIMYKERDSLLSFLKNKNIICGIHYPLPLHLQPAFSFLGYKKDDFPNAERLASESLSLPMFPELKNIEIRYISTQIRDFFQ